jgi:hypothetical protein
MSSRLENFHNQSIVGGSKQFIESAIGILHQNLADNTHLTGKHIYAIMKLYSAEAYRGDIKGALVHLNGARAVYNRLEKRAALELGSHYSPTLWGVGETMLLPQLWDTPTTFPTVGDPGHGHLCFPAELLPEYLGASDETAESLLPYVNSLDEGTHNLSPLRQLIFDLTEYAAVRRTMSAHEAQCHPVLPSVTQWAHLRRFALVFRLLSINAMRDPLVHALRLALVIWLAIVVDFVGFERSIEMVVGHLREIISLISKEEMARNPHVTAWIMLLAAGVSEGEMRAWFVWALGRLAGPAENMMQWFLYVEVISRRCLYCETIQQQSLVELANELYLNRWSLDAVSVGTWYVDGEIT